MGNGRPGSAAQLGLRLRRRSRDRLRASDNLVGTTGHNGRRLGPAAISSRAPPVAAASTSWGAERAATSWRGTISSATNVTGGTAAVGNGDGLFLAELDSTNSIGVNTVYGAESSEFQENVISGNELGTRVLRFLSPGGCRQPDLGYERVPDRRRSPICTGVLFDGTGSFNLLGTSGQDGSNDALERNVISGNTDVGVVVGSIFPTGFRAEAR